MFGRPVIPCESRPRQEPEGTMPEASLAESEGTMPEAPLAFLMYKLQPCVFLDYERCRQGHAGPGMLPTCCGLSDSSSC